VNKGPAPNTVFDVSGTTYALGSASLHVYVFRSAAAREKAVGGIDTVKVVKRGEAPTWSAPAWLITSNNLAAVLISDNGQTVERVQNAITAGLPATSK
jgi:hypothetical protein